MILNPNPAQPKCTVYRSANIRSRSSGESWTSALQDKLPSTPINFSTCGGIDLVKRGDDGQLLTGAKFKLNRSADSVLDAGDPQVGPECTTDAQGACAWGGLVPGFYFVTETAPTVGYSLDATRAGSTWRTAPRRPGSTGTSPSAPTTRPTWSAPTTPSR